VYSKPILVTLALLLAGCGSLPHPEVRVLTPPEDLLRDCPFAARPLATNKDLAEAYLEVRSVLQLCNNDKAALREWAREARTQK